jgi:type VI secretion system secreted protein VgrG
MADGTGTAQDHINYDGFGNVTNETSSTFGDRYKWTGREFDSESGLQCNRIRYYDAITARWGTQDPIGFNAGDTNLYRYVRNNATNTTDPTGLLEPGTATLSGAGTALGTVAGFSAFTIGTIIVAPIIIGGEIIVITNTGGAADKLGAWFAGVDYAIQTKPIPPPPPNRPRPKKGPDGDCTPQERRFLQDAVNAACKIKRACDGTQDLATLYANLAMNLACASARDAINLRCFEGGDTGHQQAANEARAAAMNCMSWIFKKGGMPPVIP